MHHPKPQDGIPAQATEWFLRLREPGVRNTEAAEFSEWLTRSPECLEEFLAVSLAWSVLESPTGSGLSAEALIEAARADGDGSSNVVALPGRQSIAGPTLREKPRAALRSIAVAAVALLVVCAIGWLESQHGLATPVYTTAAGEHRTVTLTDGSVVTLGPGSRMALRWTAAQRRVELPAGTARFRVAGNPRRPFVVDTAYGQVEDVGTIFDVTADPFDTRVRVIEGRVAVSAAGSRDAGDSLSAGRLVLSAGDHARIGGGIADTRSAARSVIAWTAGRLLIRDAPLGAVIGELDRSHSRRLILADTRLATLTISGVFDATDTGPLLRYLELYQGVRVERAPDGSVRLSAGTPTRP